jgi:glycosyltransferase involved in cell wall biosynthesis
MPIIKRLIVGLVTSYPSRRNMRRAREVRAIESSGMFNGQQYDLESGASAAGWSPAKHYVWLGERIDLKPSLDFDPAFYRRQNPDVTNADVNLFAHFITQGKQEGRLSRRQSLEIEDTQKPSLNGSILELASRHSDTLKKPDHELIERSGLFDAAIYRLSVPGLSQDADEISHYLEVGEKKNFPPSFDFDPGFYRERNADVGSSGTSLLLHYITHGKEERRSGVPFENLIESFDKNLNASRRTVVLIIHEASQTGAPILGLNIAKLLRYTCNYNVVVISRRKGVIADAFRADVDVYVEPGGDGHLSPAEIGYLAAVCRHHVKPRYVIANSAVCFDVAVAFEKAGLAVVALIHEFSSLFGSKVVLKDYFKSISALVFPAQIVRNAAIDDYPELTQRHTYVLPQGRSAVPDVGADHGRGGKLSRSESTPAVLKWSKWSDCVTVVGLGTVEWRKGVDVFVATAVSYFSRFPRDSCRFVWVGAQTQQSHEIAIYLHEQLARSEITDSVLFLPETSNLADVYANVDLLFVSSRLDPLPNVAIDAMLEGIPVLSFAGATGISDLLSPLPDLGRLVVPYLNAEAAAQVIRELVVDVALRSKLGHDIETFARTAFDMRAYVVALDEIGRNAANKKSASQD